MPTDRMNKVMHTNGKNWKTSPAQRRVNTIRSTVRLFCAAAVALLTAAPVYATLLTWDFAGIFSEAAGGDDASLTGMVTLDVATGQPVAWGITTGDGVLIVASNPGRFPGFVYTPEISTARVIDFDLGLKTAFDTTDRLFAWLVTNENAIPTRPTWQAGDRVHVAIDTEAAAPTTMPEPGTLLLMASALPALGFIRRWRLPPKHSTIT